MNISRIQSSLLHAGVPPSNIKFLVEASCRIRRLPSVVTTETSIWHDRTYAARAQVSVRASSSSTLSKSGKNWEQFTRTILDETNGKPGRLTTSAVDKIFRAMEHWTMSDTSEGAFQASLLMQKLLGEYGEGNKYAEPDRELTNMVIYSLEQHAGQDFLHHAKGILYQMEKVFTPNDIPYRVFIGHLCRHGTMKSAELAEALVFKIYNLFKDGKIDMGTSTETFNSAITGYFRCNDGARAEAVLKKMERLYDDGDLIDGSFPNKISYGLVIAAYKADKTWGSAFKADEVFRRMETAYEAGNYHVKPDMASYVDLIYILTKSKEPGSEQRAGEILSDAIQKCETAGRDGTFTDIIPGRTLFNLVMTAYSNSGEGEKAEAVLRDMKHHHDTGFNNGVKPEKIEYNTCIAAWANTQKYHSGDRAAALLSEMMESGDDALQPDSWSFNSVIAAYTRQKDGAEKAAGILQLMNKLYLAGKYDVQPDNISISNMLATMAKNRTPETALQVETLLKQMDKLYNAGNEKMKPDAITYSMAINAVATSHSKDAVEIVENIVRRLMINFKAGDCNCEPDTVMFNGLLQTYRNSNTKVLADKAEALLHKMEQMYEKGMNSVKPNAISYWIVLSAFAANGSGKRADTILYRMLKLAATDDDVQPNERCFSTVIATYAVKGHTKRAQEIFDDLMKRFKSGRNELRPSRLCFTTIVAAQKLSESGLIIQTMLELYKAGAKDLKPDMRQIQKVMNELAKHAKYKSAEAILSLLIELHEAGDENMKPGIDIFLAVISAHAKKGNAELAENIFHKMLDFENAGNPGVKPNIDIGNLVVKAWSRSGREDALKQAELHVQRMQSLYDAGNDEIKPNRLTYHNLLFAVKDLSTVADKAERSRDILFRMHQLNESGAGDVEPNSRTYNMVILAISKTEGNEEQTKSAYQMALKTLKEMREAGREKIAPNQYTYPAILTACANLLEPEKSHKHILELFLLCCKDGLLDVKVLNLLKQIAPDILARFVTPTSSGVIELSDFPTEWSANRDSKER